MFENYSCAGIPLAFNGLHSKVTAREISEVLMGVNNKSSPGYPYFHHADSKGKYKQIKSHDLVGLVRDRITVLCETRPEDFSKLTGKELVELGIADLVKVHIKNEPTPIEKLNKKRARIIMVESFATEVTTKLLFGPQTKIEIANWERNPSKPGFGASTDEQSARLYNSVHDPDNACDSDMSGFDWSMSTWMFDMAIDTHLEQVGAVDGSIYANACRNLIHILGNSVYLTSNGDMVELEEPGVMNSGSALTSWLNSRIRYMLGILAGHSHVITMGDDAVHDWIPNATEAYEKLGLRLKNFDNQGVGCFNFCSSDVYATHSVPKGVWKSFRNLLWKPYDASELAEFMYLTRHAPERDEMAETMVSIGYATPEQVTDALDLEGRH